MSFQIFSETFPGQVLLIFLVYDLFLNVLVVNVWHLKENVKKEEGTKRLPTL